jgi:hypothetical protein
MILNLRGKGEGGGICLTGGEAILMNATIVSNLTLYRSYWPDGIPGGTFGGGLSSTNTVVILRNSITANNINGGQVSGRVTDAGHNICSDATANLSASGSLSKTDPLLGPLQDNGGPTPTMMLLPGSRGINAVGSGFPPLDQRGRPRWGAADIGAVEVSTPQLTIASVSTNLSINFVAERSGTYQLYSSTNLLLWTQIAVKNSVKAGNNVRFLRPLPSDENRYYRVIAPAK